MFDMSEVIGLTTTVPIEILLAGGHRPLDLNNLFITDEQCNQRVARAEFDGYPETTCGWIKGLYATVLELGIKRIVAVTQGDCSQTHAMLETLQAQGVEVFPFAYPYDRDAGLLQAQMARMAQYFGTTIEAAEDMRIKLLPLREQLAELDRLTWQDGTVSGAENHLFLVSASDFNGNVEGFQKDLEKLLSKAAHGPTYSGRVRLGIIGVPPIISNLHEMLAQLGGHVVYNEVPRQFSMIPYLDCDLLEQYRRYTYPYDVFGRIKDIKEQIEERKIEGIIHYVQTFCFRQIQDLLLKQQLPVPVLTLQGDKPAPLDARNRLRIEAFFETLEARRRL